MWDRWRQQVLTAAAGVGLFVVGRYATGDITVRGLTWGLAPTDATFGWVWPLRFAFAAAFVFLVLHLVGAFTSAVKAAAGENRQASLGQGLFGLGVLGLASDQAELDKRPIAWGAGVAGGLFFATHLPAWVWVAVEAGGLAVLGGMVLGVLAGELLPAEPRWARFLPGWVLGDGEVSEPVEPGNPGRDARKIKREWRRLALDLLSKTEGGGARAKGPRPKIPKLVGMPRVTHRAVMLTIEPPDAWPRDYVSQFGGWLMHHWNGKQLEVGNAEAGRMARRRMTIDVVLEPLPKRLPMPDPIVISPTGGVPLGEDLRGDVVRMEIGPQGVPHVLVAGTSGSGKSTGMRAMGLGLVAAGAELIGIDPKGEGDLEGMGASRILYRPDDWVAHCDWLIDEQERRRELKRRGDDFGRPVVSMIDEVIQIATGLGARDKRELDALGKAWEALLRAITIGRGTGLHIISGTQQASAAAFGDKLGTLYRNQHLGRVIFGRGAMRTDVDMVMAGRPVTPEDLEQMVESPKGRAWVSGLIDNGDMRVRAMQFYLVPEVYESLRRERQAREAAGEVRGEHDGSEPLTLAGGLDLPEPTDEVGERRALRDLVLDELRRHGSMERAELCRRISDPPVDTSTMRGTLGRLERAGLVRTSGGEGNSPVVVHLAAERVPSGG